MKENWKEYAPIIGIFVFASGNVHSLRYLFGLRAEHDSSLYWLLSIFIELVTAFAIWRIVEMVRLVTKTRQTTENRKFYKILLWSIAILIIPSLLTSIWANYEEFNRSIPLAFLCPLLTIVCAVLSGIPQAEKAFKQAKEEELEARRIGICKTCGMEVERKLLKRGRCLDCQRSAEGKTHSLPLELSLKVLERDEWICYYCGANLREVPAGERHIDHFVPKSQGGQDVIENLVTACQHCNLTKNDKMPNEREQYKFSLYLRAKLAGPDRRSQILELARSNGDQRPLKQKEIAEILRTSPGWVSTVIREDEENR